MPEYYFELPKYNDLTSEQRAALDNPGPISLTGSAGTGKSLVSFWRHFRNISAKKKCHLITFTNDLTNYFKRLANSESNNSHINNIFSYIEWNKYPSNDLDEIIIDEAQDNGLDFYRNIKKNKIAKFVSYGADDNQILYPTGCSCESDLRNIFDKNSEYVLYQNFRNTNEILLFTKSFLIDFFIPQFTIEDLIKRRITGKKPTICFWKNNEFHRRDTFIVDLINQFKSDTHNIGILVFDANQINSYHLDITSIIKNVQISRKGEYIIRTIHITSYKASKGLEFDTVIVPDFQNFILDTPNLNNEDFFVLFTRAKKNLFLITNDNLRLTVNNLIQFNTFEIKNI